jgi:lipopolysaccharide export system protein LptA
MQMRQTIRPALVALYLAMAGSAAAQVAVGFGGVAHDASQQVEVVSDSLTIDQTSGRAVFSGNVVILQGDLRMAAERVEVIYSDADGQRSVDEVMASGGVLVTRGEDAAEGDEAQYDIAAGLMTLSGDVLVTQGATTIAGDSMILDMTTGNGTVSGRVRTILTPEQQP